MIKRGLLYHCGILWRWVLDIPGTVLLAVSCTHAPTETRHGIRILDDLAETRPYFTNLVGSALDLIARSDPMRMKRVRAEIRTIASTSGIIGAVYQRPLRLCCLNLGSFYDPVDPDGDLTLQLLASAIICKATQGYLVSRGALPTPRNALRFRNICFTKEVKRFLRRLGAVNPKWDPGQVVDVNIRDSLGFAATAVPALFLLDPAAKVEALRKLVKPSRPES